MAQEQSIEAARTRIQRLVEEIAALSKQELRSEDFFQQFLARVVQATDARGGAVWLVAQRSADGKSEFQLAAEHELDSSLFRADEAQHAILLRALLETVKSRKPFIAPPEPSGPAPGSLEAQVAQLQGQTPTAQGTNKTPFPFFHIPLLVKEQVLGVLQVWLQPYVTQPAYAEFIAFLSSLASHVEQHLQSRRLGTMVVENQRLHHVLKFSSDLAGSLDPLEVARLAANYGRDLLGCERCSILVLRGDRWQVLSISGQEVVEKKSSMVKAMNAFVGAHARPERFLKPVGELQVEGQPRHEMFVLSKKELLARAEAVSTIGNGNGNGDAKGEHVAVLSPEARRTDEIDLAYFEHSHVVSAAIAPMFNQENELTGAYFAESTTEGFFDNAPGAKEPSPTQRLGEWLAIHTSRSLQAAQDYHSLPLLGISKRIRDTKYALTGRKRGRFLFRSALAGAIVLGLALYPKTNQVDGNCAISPVHKNVVASEIPGRVEKIFVREGDRVTKGQPLAQLDKGRLETALETTRQERARMEAEADRYRGLGDEAGAQVAMLQARVSEQEEKKLQTDIAASTLRSPIDGVIMTKDLELRSGEPIQPGSQFVEIAALDQWELQVEVNERTIGRLEKALEETKPLPVNYILYSQSAHKLNAELEDATQISAQAYPRDTQQVFIITLRDITVPPALKDQLRPGLTGRAKVVLGREPMAVWAFERLSNWLRLKFIR